MPQFNNNPTNDAGVNAKFDPNLNDEVYKICGCDPAHYFEFIFRNVRVNQVTYCDGSSANAVVEDPVLGQRILLNGIMADISPSAVGAQLFSATAKVGNLMSGKLRYAMQSDLRTNVRPLDTSEPFDQENVGAHFETILDLTDKVTTKDSRFLMELGDITQLEFYMHTNRYTIWNTTTGYPKDRLNGDVYGYIRPVQPKIDNNGVRIKGRLLVAHPALKETSERLSKIYLGTTPLTRNTDIDGTYDLFKETQLLLIRYLDFIPQLDRDYNTPTDKGIVKEYVVLFTNRKNAGYRIELGRFKGDHPEMKRTGGFLVFKIPPTGMFDLEDLILEVEAVPYDGVKNIPLMTESEWDIILECERGVTLCSGRTGDIEATIYHVNRPVHNCPVNLFTQPSGEVFFHRRSNRRSPIVAKWKDDKEKLITDIYGKIKAKVQAIDLKNSPEIFDPVKNKYVHGELEWDRYYGNYVYLEINNDLRRFQYRAVEQIEIPVRVLHIVNDLDPISTNRITFRDDIFPKLLKFYVRYFPWLHTIESADETFIQFLNLESYDEVKSNIGEILHRLGLNDNEWNKMPRSRDFPIGGIEMIKQWLVGGMPE